MYLITIRSIYCIDVYWKLLMCSNCEAINLVSVFLNEHHYIAQSINRPCTRTSSIPFPLCCPSVFNELENFKYAMGHKDCCRWRATEKERRNQNTHIQLTRHIELYARKKGKENNTVTKFKWMKKINAAAKESIGNETFAKNCTYIHVWKNRKS